MPRIASFLVPLFPLAARLRSEPELFLEAVAIVDGNGNLAHVVAATRRARKGGIRPGLSLPQARSMMPKLIVRPRDAECERTAQEALLEVAESFSPRVEDGGEGVVYLDISGLERLYQRETIDPKSPPAKSTVRSSSSVRESAEHNLAQAALRTAGALGMPIRVGIAASKLAARIAAELPSSPTIVPAGEEAKFLAPLPLSRLTPAMAAATTMERWGIAAIGELARLPEGKVASRLGEIGRELHWLARGIDPRPLMPRLPSPEFREGMDLEWPLVALEAFLFIASAAMDRLSNRLLTAGYSCRKLDLTLRLEPDGFHARSIDLPAPTRDVKTLLTLIRLDLEANPPGAPVAGFTLVAHPDRARRAQLSLFGPAALSPDKLATAIARIISLLGEDRVGTPVATDSHAPERFSIATYDPPPPPEVRRSPRRGRGFMAVRVLRPAVELEVITTGENGSFKLASIQSITPPDVGDTPTSKPIEISGSVRVCSGPWNFEEAWWGDSPSDREYWDVELSSGGVYRVFRTHNPDSWFSDGVYD